MLTHVDFNSDVWLGGTYWAAGPWNQDSFSIEPDVVGGAYVDRPQLAVLQDHVAAVPEPGTWGLMALGLIGGVFGWMLRKGGPASRGRRLAS